MRWPPLCMLLRFRLQQLGPRLVWYRYDYCLMCALQRTVLMLEVVRSRNAASISPLMTAGAMFASLAWIFYSVLAGDVYYLAISVAGLVSCCAQVCCLLRYARFQVAQDCDVEGDAIELLSAGMLEHDVVTVPPIKQ